MNSSFIHAQHTIKCTIQLRSTEYLCERCTSQTTTLRYDDNWCSLLQNIKYSVPFCSKVWSIMFETTHLNSGSFIWRRFKALFLVVYFATFPSFLLPWKIRGEQDGPWNKNIPIQEFKPKKTNVPYFLMEYHTHKDSPNLKQK